MADGEHLLDKDLQVLLHVGVPKTATTAIQTCLAARRDELLKLGVLYPGKGPNQQPAIKAVTDAGPDSPPEASHAWTRMSSRVRRHAGRSILSAEWAALVSPPMARRIVDDLGSEGVHVVITLRPLEVLLASMWQQSLKMGAPTPLDRWLADVTRGPRPDDGPSNLFWYVQDHAAVVRTWMSAVGPRRVHVVIVDRSTPNVVFDTFGRLLQLPAGYLDPAYSTSSNRSLTWPEAEMVRQLHERWYEPDQDDAIRDSTIRSATNFMIERRQPPPEEPAIHVPRTYIERIRLESRRIVDDLRTLDTDVIGDLEALCPTTPIVDLGNDPVTTISIDAAVTLMEGITRRVASVTRS